MHFQEFSRKNLRLEMFIQFPLEQVTDVIVLGERLSNFQTDEFGTVAKNLSFQVPIKMFQNLELFFVIVFAMPILFFLRPKSPEKRGK